MKKTLLILLLFVTAIVSQITDVSILNIKSFNVDYSNPIITVPDGYGVMREPSPVIEYNGKLIWVTTFVKDNVHSLHRFECSINDEKNWSYKGKLSLKGQGGVELEGEDPTFAITSTGEIHLLCENKSYEKSHNFFTIAKYIAADWDSPFYFQGGSTGVSPFGNGKAKDAVYSPDFTDKYNPFAPIHLDGRTGIHEENIFYAVWNGTEYIPDPEPIFSVDDISLPIKTRPNSKVLTTGIGDTSFEIKKADGSIKYIMETVAFKDWDYDKWLSGTGGYNGYWCQGLAVSNSLRTGWQELDSEIKDQNGENTAFSLFYNNAWKALVGKSNKIYLAEIVTGSVPDPEPDPDNPFFLPDDVPGVSYNTVLMRELRPLVLGFTLPPEEEADRGRTINLLDEVGHYEPFDKREK